ncbi:MAG TPA: branched-chain amino acid ABC transporter permease [Methylomirabilota bacterium]
MPFLLTVLVDGALTGALYALVAVSFVIVYRSSRMINFALGDWTMLGAGLVAAGVHAAGVGLLAATVAGCLGMIALGLGFNRAVVRRLIGGPVIASLMVTLGVGALIRGASAVGLRGLTGRIELPIPPEPIALQGVLVSTEKLVAAGVAALAIGATAGLFRWSRSGLALRAIADDQQVALAMGIDVQRHFALIWALVGVLSVIAGTLWTFVAGSGFGLALVGLKIFPIVILGGLDSIVGTIVAAALVGMVESLAAGYLDAHLGSGFGGITAYLLLVVMLAVRPRGLLGRGEAVRV